MWKMIVQKGIMENSHQVSAYFDDGSGRHVNHICRGWFVAVDETEILKRQLDAVMRMREIRDLCAMVSVSLQGARGYDPKIPITVGQLERELSELILV